MTRCRVVRGLHDDVAQDAAVFVGLLREAVVAGGTGLGASKNRRPRTVVALTGQARFLNNFVIVTGN